MSAQVYHLDYETFSRVNIKKLGAYRYANDSSTRILLCAVARDGEAPVLWDASDPTCDESVRALGIIYQISNDPECLVYAHNSGFEQAITKYHWEDTFCCKPPTIEQWRCTAAMARRAALPFSLDGLATFLKLPMQKDKRGEQLIQIFCCPKKSTKKGVQTSRRIMPDDLLSEVTVGGVKMSVVKAWELFKHYCRQDVRTEMQAYHKLAPLIFKGMTLKGFLMDARLNDFGIPVNTDALKKGQKLVDECSAELTAQFRAITGFNPSQRDKCFQWLKERGYPGEDLREQSMDDCLKSPPPEMSKKALQALNLRSLVSFAAVKKLTAMSNVACDDGRVRGSLMWSGALRTHRAAGRLIQPQNFRRPTPSLKKETGDIYNAICHEWGKDVMNFMWGNPVEATASVVRHFIHDPGHEFLDLDFANIEARIAPYLAGQEDLLREFAKMDELKRNGAPPEVLKCHDPYVLMAEKIFSVEPPDINDDQRFVGKQAVLGCGFQCQWPKFQFMCAGYGRNLPDDLCAATVKAYREKNDRIVSMWKIMQKTAVQAIENPDMSFTVRNKLVFRMATTLPFPALLMVLPSGHQLVYPQPALKQIWIFQKKKYNTQEEAMNAYHRAKRRGELEEGDRVWETTQISFYGLDQHTKQWGRITTYGGKLFENSVQATAGDFLTHGALLVEAAGYRPFMWVHDQILSYFDRKKGHSKEQFKTLMCQNPKWALDFPLEAECSIVPYYLKD